MTTPIDLCAVAADVDALRDTIAANTARIESLEVAAESMVRKLAALENRLFVSESGGDYDHAR